MTTMLNTEYTGIVTRKVSLPENDRTEKKRSLELELRLVRKSDKGKECVYIRNDSRYYC